jgi:integrase
VYPRKNKAGKVIGHRGSYWVHTAEGPKRRYVSGKNKGETRQALAKAKHGSKRLIKLPAKAVEALAGHYRDAGLMFASELGTPLDASNVVNRSSKPLLRRAGLPNIRFHDQRDTCATLLLMRHVHPKFVQKLLGHKTIAITLNLYSNWIPHMGDFTADTMDNLL